MYQKATHKNQLSPIDKEAEALIDLILKDSSFDSEHSLAAKNKSRQRLLETIGAAEYRQRIPTAFEILHEDLKNHLTIAQYSAVQQEFKTAIDKLIFLFEEKTASFQELWEKMDALPDSMQKLLGISDQTIEYCYQSGMRFFEAEYFEQAADVFFLLTVFNPYRFNVWISQGLAEKYLHQYDNALRAFSMAMIVNINSVVPMIYSVECYRELKDSNNAKTSLQLALETLKEHPTKGNKMFESYLLSLQRACQ